MATIVIGKVEIELPDYLISLNQEQVDALDLSDGNKIIACGVHSDNKVTLITSQASVRIFDPKKFHIPSGLYLPLPGGEDVYLPNIENRWPGMNKGFHVKSVWLIKNSDQELDAASLQMNNRYLGEINITPIKTSGA